MAQMLDLFNGDAFKSVTIAQAITESGYVPNRMRELGIFKPVGISTEGVAIERRDQSVSLVPVTPRGAPSPKQNHSKRDLRNFTTTRISQSDTLTASELDFVRRFGEAEATMMAQEEIARRLGTNNQNEGLLNNIGLTLEQMMLNVVTQAKFVDKDGNVLVDWGTEMRSQADIDNNVAFTIPTETFNFSTLANGDLRKKLNVIRRSIQRNSRGQLRSNENIHVLVDDEYFDALGKNAELREYYSRNAQVSYVQGNDAWNMITYAGYTFENYRGTDDQSTVDIAANTGHAFPLGEGVFKHWVSHGEDFSDLGTKGREWYIDVLPDQDRDRYVDLEVSTYPLLGCTAPQALRKFVLA